MTGGICICIPADSDGVDPISLDTTTAVEHVAGQELADGTGKPHRVSEEEVISTSISIEEGMHPTAGGSLTSSMHVPRIRQICTSI